MYAESDFAQINQKIRKNVLCLAPVLVAMGGLYVYALKFRVQPLAMASGVLLCLCALFGIVYFLAPNLRYKRFLQDMQSGLEREMVGDIVEISDQIESHDGARVHPVRLWLHREADERIVYLNVSKRDYFFPAGTPVRLKLYGRHIRQAQRLDQAAA